MDNIEVIPFKFKHFPLLIEMLKDQDYSELQSVIYKTLPKIGYIALLGKQAIFAGFLRRVEGDEVAQFDGFTSNPYFGSKIRNAAINKVIEHLLIDAKELKLKGIYAFTVDKGILNRAEAMGFHQINQTLIGLKLK